MSDTPVPLRDTRTIKKRNLAMTVEQPFFRTMTKTCLKRMKTGAKNAFPNLGETEALYEFARKHQLEGFFTSTKRERDVCLALIDYFMSNDYRSRNFSQREGYRGMKFFVPSQTPTLESVDRPKAKELTAIIVHPSEQGAKLSTDHKAHLLKLPAEIRLQILELVVSVSREKTVHPKVVTCNWKPEWSESRYEIEIPNCYPSVTEMSEYARNQREDDEGIYTEIQKVYYKSIDATCLRVCKQLYRERSKVLYGRNRFAFGMSNTSFRRSPPSYVGGQVQTWNRPDKPVLDNNRQHNITLAIENVEGQAPHESATMAYCDSLLRFLYTICPRNASFLTSLTFEGNVKIHDCYSKRCSSQCDDDLVHSLRTYVPFLNKFCTSLRKLTILAGKGGGVSIRSARIEDGPNRWNKAFLSLLEHDIRSLSTLEEIEVCDRDKVPLIVAQTTVAWFVERARAKAKEDARALEERTKLERGSA
ncbi:uncharacterized protein LY89DRAFT_784225 [Mollisia scopiformis]|uniref:Uncharacterized protein n=1 Tax=Mollisia scopiformis TaxID=149040 RepID=A0A194X332_MOLSC|nr:uncharacterized protein LY89DRAFT_784225 [Mollisia scopiformis]KUJ14237.1 hypothetical protein LY89DRAFT_784225 [Mollisia scopiformis]